jgi:hypothetical protein
MHVAALCSQAVYTKKEKKRGLILQSNGLKFTEIDHVDPSVDGNVKPTLFVSIQQDPSVEAPPSRAAEESPFSAYLPMMIIAICGTRRDTLIDWPMNLNMELKNASHFIVS